MTIEELNVQDYKIVKSTDTIFYIKQNHEGIEGKSISYDEYSFNTINAKIKFNFSFLQYTIDEIPAYPIKYTRKVYGQI